jgi:broad specificity phosphatase PhoE
MSLVLFLCRHGERVDNVEPQWRETAAEPWDPPLTHRGREHIRCSVQRICKTGVQYVLSSPMRRTVESAQVASGILGLKFEVDTGLVEWQNPAWFSGLTVGNPVWLGQASYWSGKQRNSVPPFFPETEHQAKARCAAAARRLIEQESRCGLIITHETGVIGIANGLTGSSIDHVRFGGLIELSLSHRRLE